MGKPRPGTKKAQMQEWIRWRLSANGHWPTIREISDHFDCAPRYARLVRTEMKEELG